MLTLTAEQLESELSLLVEHKINVLSPTKSTLKKYMKVKRNGQSFSVVRADRENVLNQVSEFKAMKIKRIQMSRKIFEQHDFEGAILDYQEMRDYNC